MIYNIPAGVSFTDELAKGILERWDCRKQEFCRILILLPSSRACKALKEAFLRNTEGSPILLPKIKSIANIEEEFFNIPELAEVLSSLPPVIPDIKRKTELAKLISIVKPKITFDQALSLADDLADFLDEITIYDIDKEELKTLAPDDLAEHWQEIMDFIKVLSENWNDFLNEKGYIDRAYRQKIILEEFIKILDTPTSILPPEGGVREEEPPQRDDTVLSPPSLGERDRVGLFNHPIIIAGNKTPSPQITKLLKAVNERDNGFVVFPALEEEKDLPPTHPQYSVNKLFAGIKNISHPKLWTECNPNQHRINLLKEALKPPHQTADWLNAEIDEKALTGLSLHTFRSLEEEAAGISLMFRECLEEKGKTAVCITPDRNLARRIVANMKRFGVDINDSGGSPLKNLPTMVFLRLVAGAANLEPVPILALLKHPFCLCGLDRKELLDRTRQLEKEILRGVRPDIEVIKKEFSFLYEKIKPFADLIEDGNADFNALLREHIKCAEKIANPSSSNQILPKLKLSLVLKFRFGDLLQFKEIPKTSFFYEIKNFLKMSFENDEEISPPLWQKDEGEAASNFIRELLETDIGKIKGEQYLPIFEQIIEGQVFRPKFSSHPRINILGTIEANLQTADMVIIAGLNEGVFPAHSSSGIWLSRPMREELGLPSPDEKTGLTAHDFFMAASSKEVIMTRAEKAGGTPTIPSRWLLRLETLVKAKGMEIPQGKDWSKWTRLLDKPDKVDFAPHTSANPPLSARPSRLSVTQIETLLQDPYSIYAKKVLRLEPLKDIDEALSIADFGTAVHKALEEYVKHNGEMTLLECGRKAFGTMLDKPIVKSFWWSRFERIAQWFVEEHSKREFISVETEKSLRMQINSSPFTVESKSEVGSQLDAPSPHPSPLKEEGVTSRQGDGDSSKNFTLTGKADRIERTKEGDIIADYKTGSIPPIKKVLEGLSPQLLLLALLGRENGYRPTEVEYWKLSGKDDSITRIINNKTDISDKLDETKEELIKLIETFFCRETPFIACPDGENSPKYNDYEHLERIK